MFRITIEEIIPIKLTVDGVPETDQGSVQRYQQTVDELDLRAVMAAVNKRPRKPRVRKEAKSTA